MEINGITLSRLRNEEHYKFQFDFSYLIEKYTPLALGIISLVDKHAQLLLDEHSVLNALLKNPLTNEINELDEIRDGLSIGLRGTVKYATYHYDVSIQEAAIKLMPLFERYGEFEKRSLSEETAAIMKLVSELEGTYSELCQTVGVAGWVPPLKEANLKLDSLVKNRNADWSLKPKVQLKDVRLLIDSQYRAIVKRLNAILELTPQEVHIAFANELNQYIEKRNILLAQRKGRNAKDTDNPGGGEEELKK